MFDNKFDRCYDMGMTGNQYTNIATDPGFDEGTPNMKDYNMEGYNMEMSGCKMDPIVEKGCEKCVHRTICHEVEHICPVNTRVINHHVYRHVYKPCYTSCEVSHINEGSCCCFR